MLLGEIIILCAMLFVLCILGTGTEDKNLKNYSSYPDEVQTQIQQIEVYQGRFKVRGAWATWMANFLLFLLLFLFLGLIIRQSDFGHNFIFLLILGQTLNIFDLIVIDLLWWRNAKRIRLLEIPQKDLYQNPKKHIEAFLRAAIMFLLVALIDGYILTLF